MLQDDIINDDITTNVINASVLPIVRKWCRVLNKGFKVTILLFALCPKFVYGLFLPEKK